MENYHICMHILKKILELVLGFLKTNLSAQTVSLLEG